MIWLMIDCSGCDSTFRQSPRGPVNFWELARDLGWTEGRSNYGEHYCPECTAIRKAEAAAQKPAGVAP